MPLRTFQIHLNKGTRWSLIALSLAAGLMAGLTGCGDDGEDEAVTNPASPSALATLDEPPPKGASPLLREIYRQFQPPEADPARKGSGAAIRAGVRACRGKTPLEVREEFIAGSDLSPDQAKAVAKLRSYERQPSPSFVAGQLAALVYEKSLPENAVAGYGFQGCIYVLSNRLKRQLAPGAR